MGKNSKSETNDDQVIGVNWYWDVFLKDNPDMVNKLGKGLDHNHATCASHTQLEKWYLVVFDTGNVWVILGLPVPLPIKYLDLQQGSRFL